MRCAARLGMLFQFGALFTDLTVFENIAFPLREHTDLPDDMIRDLVLLKLNAVGLRGAASFKPSELSGGMARRVALARAVALDPMLVMYDEPFAGLDPISLGVIGQLIRQLNDALGSTSVVVTHDVYESLKIVDYLYFVSEGRIVAGGTPAEVRASTDPFVRQFVDARAGRSGAVPLRGAAARRGSRSCALTRRRVAFGSWARRRSARSSGSVSRRVSSSPCSITRRARFAACTSRCARSTSRACCRS